MKKILAAVLLVAATNVFADTITNDTTKVKATQPFAWNVAQVGQVITIKNDTSGFYTAVISVNTSSSIYPIDVATVTCGDKAPEGVQPGSSLICAIPSGKTAQITIKAEDFKNGFGSAGVYTVME